ncbi:MAG: hypothetical protein Kow0063_23340 [Anaerolineae bacterium]
MAPEPSRQITLLEKVWVPIIVALIGLAGVIAVALINRNDHSAGEVVTPAGADFSYQVRVQSKDTGKEIMGAEVTIDVGGKAPLDDVTDSKGVARIFVSSSYMGKPGLLIVEAKGYKKHTQKIDLIKDALPDIVQLEQESQ